MSVQTDCEMLYVQAMEAYARKYHVSGNSVVELFHENQVFEKMMIQHEYLHQISFEEVLEYVEKIIMEGSKELVVYHGSCYEFENIDLNKSHNRRDFGKGFYTTILQSQSKEWGYRLSLREKKKKYFVWFLCKGRLYKDSDIDIKPIAKNQEHFYKWAEVYPFYSNVMSEGVKLFDVA